MCVCVEWFESYEVCGMNLRENIERGIEEFSYKLCYICVLIIVIYVRMNCC